MHTIEIGELCLVTGGASQNGADYTCGPYNLELKGPDQASLFRSGQRVGSWSSEAETPVLYDKRGMSLVRDNKVYRCKRQK